MRGLGARSVEALDAALAQAVDAITLGDATGYLRHAGSAVEYAENGFRGVTACPRALNPA